MMHLPVHLATEARIGGPVQYRWMYPIERYLHILKSYVRNKAYPEGSIAEGYIADECLTFCSRYLADIGTRFNRLERNFDGGQPTSKESFSIFSHSGRPMSGGQPYIFTDVERDQANFYVLQNCEEVSTYIKVDMLRGTGRRNLFAGSSSRQPMLNDSLYVDSDAETEDYNDRESQSVHLTSVRRRGRAKGILLPENDDGKKKVQFDKSGCPVGRHSRKFVTKMGVLVKDQKQFPFYERRYSDFPMLKFNELARVTKMYFNLEYTGDVPKLLRAFCRKIWNNTRSRLYREYYLPHESYEVALQHSPKGMDEDDWKKICDVFEEERWLKISDRNKANRAQQKVAHIAGRMSFAQRKFQLREKLGRSPQKRECWNYNHINKNNRGPNEYTEEITRRITALIDSGIMDEGEVFEEVLGPDKRGRIHGEGRIIHSFNEDSAIQSQVEDLRRENNLIREENRELKENFQEIKERMTMMERIIKSVGQYGLQFPAPSTTPYMASFGPQQQMTFQQLLHFEEQPMMSRTQSFPVQPFEHPLLSTQPHLQPQSSRQQPQPHLQDQSGNCPVNS